MKTAHNVLHSLRGQQLKALVQLGAYNVIRPDFEKIRLYYDLSGANYDTQNLSDKQLEEIDALSLRYLERIA